MCLYHFNPRIIIVMEKDIVDKPLVSAFFTVRAVPYRITFRITGYRKLFHIHGKSNTAISPTVAIIQITSQKNWFTNIIQFVIDYIRPLYPLCVIKVTMNTYENKLIQIGSHRYAWLVAGQSDLFYFTYGIIVFIRLPQPTLPPSHLAHCRTRVCNSVRSLCLFAPVNSVFPCYLPHCQVLQRNHIGIQCFNDRSQQSRIGIINTAGISPAFTIMSIIS